MIAAGCVGGALVRSISRSVSRNYAAGASFLSGVPLVKGSNEQSVAVGDLKNKAIILYFSAGWCGHCRLFTPKLKKWYEEAAKNENVEVVWVSRDKKHEDQLKYYNKALPDVPFIPFGDKHISEYLKKYDIVTIPKAILVNDKGEAVGKDVRHRIEEEGKQDGAKLAKEFRNSV